MEIYNKIRRIGGDYLHEHGILLYELAKSIGNGTILELGIGIGRSTRIMLLGLEGILYSIDNGRGKQFIVRYKNHPHWKFIEGYDLDVLPNLDIQVDMCFVDLDLNSDKSHYFKQLTLIHNLLKEDGFIVMKNTTINPKELKAIELFSNIYKYEFTSYSKRHGITILSKNLNKVKNIIKELETKIGMLK